MFFPTMQYRNVLPQTSPLVEKQKALLQGERHSNRYFPKLHPLDHNMDLEADGEWRLQAMCRDTWRSKLDAWIRRMDVPWCSGQQDALMMY